MIFNFLKRSLKSKADLAVSAKFLKKQKTLETILIKTQKGVIKYSEKDFQKDFEIIYLPHLFFDSVKNLKKVQQKCKKALKYQEITEKEIWLGTYYEKEVAQGYNSNVYVKYVDKYKGHGLFALKDLSLTSCFRK